MTYDLSPVTEILYLGTQFSNYEHMQQVNHCIINLCYKNDCQCSYMPLNVKIHQVSLIVGKEQPDKISYFDLIFIIHAIYSQL